MTLSPTNDILKSSDQEKAVALRNTWWLPPPANRVILHEGFAEVNETGYRPRLKLLEGVTGSIVSVGAADRVLTLFGTSATVSAGVHVELNPLFSEAALPFYAQAILESDDKPEKTLAFIRDNQDLFKLLLEAAFVSNRHNQIMSKSYCESFDAQTAPTRFIGYLESNQRDLLGKSWLYDQQTLAWVHKLAVASKIKALTADVGLTQTWTKIGQELETLTGSPIPAVIDVSNVYSANWEGPGMFANMFTSGILTGKPDQLVLGSGNLVQIAEFSLRYEQDQLLGPWYNRKLWNHSTQKDVTAWIIRGDDPFLTVKARE